MPTVVHARTWITLSLVGLVPLGAGFMLGEFSPDWRWMHHPVHALVESVGALIALIVAVLIFQLRRSGQEAPVLLWVACALLAMGLLDGFHAATHAGRAFVWLHSIATFAGGMLFACVCLPDAVARHPTMQRLPIVTVVVATYVGILSIALAQQLPVMTDARGFTWTAKVLNILGGLGFVVATTSFVRRHASGRWDESLLFAHHCLLFGVASLVFVSSELWDASWWLWHFLRLAAYLVVLVYFFQMYRRALQAVRETALGLEGQVAERTRELSAGLEARRQAENDLAKQNQELQVQRRAALKLAQDAEEARGRAEKAERALRESSEHVRNLLDATAEAIYGIDLEGNFSFCNRACLQMLGYASSTDLIGRNTHALIHHSRRDGTPYPADDCPNLQTIRSGNGAHVVDEVYWRADGTCFPAEYWSHPVRRDNQLVGAVVAFWDITERKRVEQELRLAHHELENRVAERTLELSTANVALEARAQQMRGLADAAVAINSAGSFDDVIQVLTYQARHVIGAHQSVTSFTTDKNWAQAVTGLSLSDKYADYRTYDVKPDGSGIYAIVCESNQPIRLTQDELEAHPRWRNFGAEAGKHPPMAGWLAVPLVAGDGSNLGLIQLSDKYEGDFTEQDQLILVQLAQIGSVALEIRKARAELELRVQQRTAELRMSTERLDLALRSSGVGTWDWSVVENSIIWDDFIHPLFGLEPGSFPGRYEAFLALLHPEDRERVAQEVAAAVDKDAAYNTEYQVIWPDGSVHVLGSRAKVYRDHQGRALQMTGVCWDITEQKRAQETVARQAQELARSNVELEQFAYIASHDLQEPLRKVQAFGDLLVTTAAGQALDDKGRLYVERMQEGARRMQGLINDLLSLARVTSRAKPFVEVDLAQVVLDVVSDLESRIQTTGGRVEIGDLPRLEGEPMHMRQLFQNLIGNALKFHRPGTPPVVLLRSRLINEGNIASKHAAANASCEITVADNGIGFEDKYLDRIFAPFQRLHGHGQYEGTGMGLAICLKIVERHGGAITARSTPGQGTTFIVTLPLKQTKGALRHA